MENLVYGHAKSNISIMFTPWSRFSDGNRMQTWNLTDHWYCEVAIFSSQSRATEQRQEISKDQQQTKQKYLIKFSAE